MWGSVSCPRTLRHADWRAGNQTTDLLIGGRMVALPLSHVIVHHLYCKNQFLLIFLVINRGQSYVTCCHSPPFPYFLSVYIVKLTIIIAIMQKQTHSQIVLLYPKSPNLNHKYGQEAVQNQLLFLLQDAKYHLNTYHYHVNKCVNV